MSTTNPQLVRIPTPAKDKPPLSKAQKEFNRLTKRIGELEAQLTEFRTAAGKLQSRIHAEYNPLINEYNQLRADLVRTFHRAYDRAEWTKTEKKKLAHLIVNLAYELIDEHGMDDLKPIFDKYETAGFDAVTAEDDAAVSEVMKEMVASMYGIEFDPAVDVSTKEKFMAYLDEQMRAKQASQAEHQQRAEETRAKRPKTAKQQAREEKKRLDERNVTKAVRTLYMDLVKAFHPDREPDETEKARKTEIMQRVTAAYEASDLMTLFRLQLEFNRIDQSPLETLAEEQLRYYNKILKQQTDELGGEPFSLQTQLGTLLNKPLAFVGSVLSLEFGFNNDVRTLKEEVKQLKKDAKAFADSPVLKAWLKTYKVR